jgi:hypothetical protein
MTKFWNGHTHTTEKPVGRRFKSGRPHHLFPDKTRPFPQRTSQNEKRSTHQIHHTKHKQNDRSSSFHLTSCRLILSRSHTARAPIHKTQNNNLRAPFGSLERSRRYTNGVSSDISLPRFVFTEVENLNLDVTHVNDVILVDVG